MTAAAAIPLAIPSGGAHGARWRRGLIALGGLWGAILLLFVRDAFDLARIWWTSSTYGHCLFVLPLIGWLVWQRRAGLAQLAPAPWAPALMWVALGGGVWLLGDAAGLAVLRHGALILMLQGAVGAMLGPAVVRALLFPLFYAFFLVPVGSELEPVLQMTTARIAVRLLEALQVPTHIEGIFITIPNGYFKVAEACSGAKFLIAMTAYGVLVGNVCFRSWLRRALVSGRGAGRVPAGERRARLRDHLHRLAHDRRCGGGVRSCRLRLAVLRAGDGGGDGGGLDPPADRKPGDPAFDAAALAAVRVRARPRPAVLAGRWR